MSTLHNHNHNREEVAGHMHVNAPGIKTGMQIDMDVKEVEVGETSVPPYSPLTATSSILSEVPDGDVEGSGSVTGRVGVAGGGEMALEGE